MTDIQNPTETIPHPPIASVSQWRADRLQLLAQEKDLTHHKDRVNALRRRLPMVKIEKDYTFEGPRGKAMLLDIFSAHRQLIIYHFMFDPAWEKGCPGCTGLINAMGDLSMLNKRDTTFALVSRAPLPKLQAYKTAQGWDFNWYSSFGSDFNYDFHATLDEKIAPIEYNYRNRAELAANGSPNPPTGESHAMSVFFRIGHEVYHTYSTYARGAESLTDAYSLLDITPYGRQEDFEDSPAGWPQMPTYGGWPD